MSEKILVLGYYNRKNFGDDLFAHVFRDIILKDHSVTICNIDDDCKIEFTDYDKIIIGGGDLINTYFFTDERIHAMRSKCTNIPVFFYGIGMSYIDLLPHLDIGDAFFMRNRKDYEIVKWRYGLNPAFYTPDLGFYLSTTSQTRVQNESTKIGVCLPYTWIASKEYSNFINGIVSLIGQLSKFAHIYFIPFDNSDSSSNSDKLFAKRLKSFLAEYEFDSQGQQRIFWTDTSNFGPTEMVQLFNSLDCCLASRFHSVILSIITSTPFVSMYTQRKLDMLRSDLTPDLQSQFITLPVDEKGIPTSVNVNDVLAKVSDTLENWENLHRVVNQTYNKFKTECEKSLKQFKEVLMTSKKRTSPPQFISDVEKTALVHKTVKAVLANLNKLSLRNIDKLWDNIPLRSLLTKRNNVAYDALAKSITEEILWQVTGDPYGPYYYGLSQACLDNGLISQINWIIDDYYTKYKFDKPSAVIINKNFQEIHRSGWQYIVNNLDVACDNLIIDTYVDKTFHWNGKFYTDHCVIPYTSKWIGFIHHTFSSYNNSYNCDTLFKNSSFLQSLKHCRCLIVMSEYLAVQIRGSLASVDMNVPVRVVSHPSEETSSLFSWDNFMKNPKRQLVQVGGWLRNVFSIFPLEIPKGSVVVGKAMLKNKNSDNYFLPPNFLQNLLDLSQASNCPTDNDTVDICRISFQNMHVKGLCQHIVDAENSVEIIEYLENDGYDKLLSQSLVFIHLVDASAVNTIIECILRNTPILVNPIPAVIELLGDNYPLYYNTTFEASSILADEFKLKAGWVYLSKMDKTRFTITNFLNNLQIIINDVA